MAGNRGEQVESSRLRRTFCISLKQLVVLFLLIVVIGAGVFWAVQRIDAHKLWMSQLYHAQRVMFHLDTVATLLNGSFQTDPTSQRWFFTELTYTYGPITELKHLDSSHQVLLMKIEGMVMALDDHGTFLLGLNSTQRSTLAETVHEVGLKLVSAYGNFLNFTSANCVTGPPFWYFNPPPPDEAVLAEAAELAVNVTAEIS